jgi:hypothetical protein
MQEGGSSDVYGEIIVATKIYTASKVKHAPMWRDLRSRGAEIVSTWIDEAGEGETADYADLSLRCLAEVVRADCVILYCEPGDVLKGALIEVGAALAVSRPVFCVGECESLSRVFSRHPLWRSCATVCEALTNAHYKRGLSPETGGR